VVGVAIFALGGRPALATQSRPYDDVRCPRSDALTFPPTLGQLDPVAEVIDLSQTSAVDPIYARAQVAGAVGGKLLGARLRLRCGE